MRNAFGLPSQPTVDLFPGAIIIYCTTDQLSLAPSPIRCVTYRTAQPWLCPATNMISNCSCSQETYLVSNILLVYFHCVLVVFLFNLPANIVPNRLCYCAPFAFPLFILLLHHTS